MVKMSLRLIKLVFKKLHKKKQSQFSRIEIANSNVTLIIIDRGINCKILLLLVLCLLKKMSRYEKILRFYIIFFR